MQSIENPDVYKPLVLTSKQREVWDILENIQTEEYPLSDWYIGALYALNNHYNPDRIAQAAHSLRELLEKLPWVIHGSDVKAKVPGFAEKRNIINERILRAKKRYPEGWKGKPIDKNLAKLLTDFEEYLELNRQPTRREQIQRTVATIDPMVNSLDGETQEAKRNQYYYLWDQLEGFAHHNPDVVEFNKCLEELENTVCDLLAPRTAQDQKEIQTILSLPDKSESDVERMFSLIERTGANFVFFFRQVSENSDVTWLSYLEKKGYFAHPPNVQLIDDESVSFPFWWPIHYLSRISNQAPDKVIELVENLPPVNNPLVHSGILEIALQLHGNLSTKLKPKILESVNIEYLSRTHRYADLLAHWVKENQISDALELSNILVRFVPDPQSREKRERRKENPMELGTTLYPSPRINNPWEYSEIMTNGVYPLAESEPYDVARFLIYTVSNVYRMRMHRGNPDEEQDFSDIWYPRLQHGPDKSYDNPDKTLIYGLTFACEKVFEKSQDAIVNLDKLLRKQQWKIFKRLRHHLYAQYPNEKTKPWIRELILEREDYNQPEHSYESQQMIRAACDHFKEKLLTREERARIFDAIISGGPSKEEFQKLEGEKFTEERFLKHQHDFHRWQLAPFASVLFGEYEAYFQKLESEADDPISDEDYPPFEIKGRWMSHRSPRSSDDLANLTDEDLLAYMNEWEKEDEFSDRDSFVRVNIEALANTFQTFFRESIIPDANRLKFWIDNRELIERPIYVRMMINAMQAHVKGRNFDQIDQWLTFSEWVLTHPDREHGGDHRRSEESRENPDWSTTRRAVSDFIRTCLEKDVDVPIVAREQLAKILETLCTQFDSRLDRNLNSINPLFDALTEGINSTRGRALEDLIKFGFWLRRYDPACEVPELTRILENRFIQENGIPRLTLPEYAILGANYRQIVHLNKIWAIKRKSNFFPQNVLPEWIAAFESLVGYSKSSTAVFNILQEDFNFALQHLSHFKNRNRFEKEPINVLGEHLFTYYLWDLYPLEGDRSLLAQYYQGTDNSPEYWGNLFNYIGHRLSNGGENLDQNLKEKIIKFCEWRLDQKNPTELRHFTFWLQAEGLDAGWRLSAYFKALDICEVEDWGFHFKTLCEMLPTHTAEVVECFLKLTERVKKDNFYIQTEEAKTILKAGRESSDEDVRHMAKRSLDNLLKSGRFVFLDLVD